MDREGAAGCVRCQRSNDDHLLRDRDEADEVQVRVWKALGWPCAEFTLTPEVIYARNQAATSRWARRLPSRPATTTAATPARIATQGAAGAREALNRALRKEAS